MSELQQKVASRTGIERLTGCVHTPAVAGALCLAQGGPGITVSSGSPKQALSIQCTRSRFTEPNPLETHNVAPVQDLEGAPLLYVQTITAQSSVAQGTAESTTAQSSVTEGCEREELQRTWQKARGLFMAQDAGLHALGAGGGL